MLILNTLVGRLGNNIIQFSTLIDMAIKHKHNVMINVNHPLFDLSVIKKYGVWGKKAFLGKKYMGIIRTTFLINSKNLINLF